MLAGGLLRLTRGIGREYHAASMLSSLIGRWRVFWPRASPHSAGSMCGRNDGAQDRLLTRGWGSAYCLNSRRAAPSHRARPLVLGWCITLATRRRGRMGGYGMLAVQSPERKVTRRWRSRLLDEAFRFPPACGKSKPHLDLVWTTLLRDEKPYSNNGRTTGLSQNAAAHRATQ